MPWPTFIGKRAMIAEYNERTTVKIRITEYSSEYKILNIEEKESIITLINN